MRSFRITLVVILAVLATAVVAYAQDPTVGSRTTATFGTFLTTPSGQTLYTFNGDTAGVSNVSGQLAVVWPPFTASAPLTLPTGVSGTLSLITRSDGSTQVAYNGAPLYTFQGDPGPNVVNGQGGAGGRFFVATAQTTGATATAVATRAASATASATAAASVSASPSASATAAATPTALPATGDPGPSSLLPIALVALGAISLGILLRHPRVS